MIVKPVDNSTEGRCAFHVVSCTPSPSRCVKVVSISLWFQGLPYDEVPKGNPRLSYQHDRERERDEIRSKEKHCQEFPTKCRANPFGKDR